MNVIVLVFEKKKFFCSIFQIRAIQKSRLCVLIYLFSILVTLFLIQVTVGLFNFCDLYLCSALLSSSLHPGPNFLHKFVPFDPSWNSARFNTLDVGFFLLHIDQYVTTRGTLKTKTIGTVLSGIARIFERKFAS